MKWYLAKIVFRIICGEGNHKPQFDEQVRFFCATDKKEALQKAFDTGRAEQDQFLNIHKQPVCWKFINVSELHKIEAMADGAELCSKITEVEDGDDYAQAIHQRAALLAITQTPSHTFV